MNIVLLSFGKSAAPDLNTFNNKSWIKLKPGLNLSLDDKIKKMKKKRYLILFHVSKAATPDLNPFNN